MRKFWAMKTYKDWWNTFNANNVIGIDQDVVNSDYTIYSDPELNELILNQNSYTEYIDRVFREFCKWMQVGDLVIIGIGQMTEFNVSGIVRVISAYYFDSERQPRHSRNVEILKSIESAIPMQRFSRTSRLEIIHETDFYEAIISMI